MGGSRIYISNHLPAVDPSIKYSLSAYCILGPEKTQICTPQGPYSTGSPPMQTEMEGRVAETDHV